MPGLGRSRKGSDDVPRTPTPSPPRQHRLLPGAKPGIRPGSARPGAGLQGKRILPGARIPPRPSTPDTQEIRKIDREVKRRECEAERQKEREERDRLLIERGEERVSITYSSFLILEIFFYLYFRWHIQQVAQRDNITSKEAEVKVNFIYMLLINYIIRYHCRFFLQVNAEQAVQSSDSDMSLSEETNFNGSAKSSLPWNNGSESKSESIEQHNTTTQKKFWTVKRLVEQNENFESTNWKKEDGTENAQMLEDSGEDKMDVCDDGEMNASESEYVKKDIVERPATSFGEMQMEKIDTNQKHENFALKHMEVGGLEAERSTDWTNTDWTEGHSLDMGRDWSNRERLHWEWNHGANDDYAGRYGYSGQAFIDTYARARPRGRYFRYGSGYNNRGERGNRRASGTGPWRPPIRGYSLPPRGLPHNRAMHSSNPRGLTRGRSGVPHPQTPRGIRSRPPIMFPRGRGGKQISPPQSGILHFAYLAPFVILVICVLASVSGFKPHS
uniref:Btz domain-containing protein n=1 Tax=Heterorhabditis bacteriophora TaxID=37862 RepID=A0A1I7XUC8_HETBA